MEDKTLLSLRFAKTRRKKNTKAVSSYAKRQKRGGIKTGATFWLQMVSCQEDPEMPKYCFTVTSRGPQRRDT